MSVAGRIVVGNYRCAARRLVDHIGSGNVTAPGGGRTWDGFVDDTNEVVVGPFGVRLAVTDWGALMVTVVEALLALATLPVQLEKAKPVFAVAVRFTNVPVA